MGWFRRTINQAYRLNGEERREIEKSEHDAYIQESKILAKQRGVEKAREDYT